MAGKEASRPVTVNLPATLHKRMVKRAAREDKSVSAVARAALIEYLKK